MSRKWSGIIIVITKWKMEFRLASSTSSHAHTHTHTRCHGARAWNNKKRKLQILLCSHLLPLIRERMCDVIIKSFYFRDTTEFWNQISLDTFRCCRIHPGRTPFKWTSILFIHSFVFYVCECEMGNFVCWQNLFVCTCEHSQNISMSRVLIHTHTKHAACLTHRCVGTQYPFRTFVFICPMSMSICFEIDWLIRTMMVVLHFSN